MVPALSEFIGRRDSVLNQVPAHMGGGPGRVCTLKLHVPSVARDDDFVPGNAAQGKYGRQRLPENQLAALITVINRSVNHIAAQVNRISQRCPLLFTVLIIGPGSTDANAHRR